MSECKKTCDNCRWFEWDFYWEVMRCSNEKSELYDLEGEPEETCPEWEETLPVPPVPGYEKKEEDK